DRRDGLDALRHPPLTDLVRHVHPVDLDAEVVRIGGDLEVRSADQLDDIARIGHAAVEAQPRHRAVHGTRVEVAVPQTTRHLPGGAGFADAAGAVDRDHAHVD